MAAIGGLEILESEYFSPSNLKEVFDKRKRTKKENRKQTYCCLLHYHDNITFEELRGRSKGVVPLPSDNSKPKPIFNLVKLILERYSSSFVDLLCKCLRFDPEQRPKAKVLLKHKFFSSDKLHRSSPVISLIDLLQISSNWVKSAYLPVEY